MEIIITNIISMASQTFVHFNSDLGSGVGHWESKNKPVISSKYNVEFHVNEELVWPENIHKTNTEISFIKVHQGDFIEVQGEIEKIEYFDEMEDVEDTGNICSMRLDNSLFIFSCANIPRDFLGYASITTHNLKIYDTNY